MMRFVYIAGLAGVAASLSAAVGYVEFPRRDAFAAVEEIVDKGAAREVIVACRGVGGKDGRRTLVHARDDRLYCDARQICHRSLTAAIRTACS